MKSSITALCIAAGLLGSGLSFAATPSAAAPTVKPYTTAAVSKPAKKHVKKHASKKVVKKAAAG